MKKVIISIVLATALFVACQKQNDLKSESLECKAYTNLYFSNYDSLKNDPITVDTLFVDGDCLKIKVNYGGCTTDHPVDLAYIYPKCGTPPLPPPTFEIRHNSRGELCKMLVTNELSFDLKPLRTDDHDHVLFIVNWFIGDNNWASKELTYTY
jgi:hypothetical protein